MEQGMELSPEQMSEREQRRTEIEQTFLVPVKSTVPSQSVLHQNPIASQTSLSVLAFFLAIQLQHRKALHHETQSLISYHRVSLDTTHLTRKAKISLSKHCMPCATTLWETLLMTASLRVKNDKYYVVLTHTTDGKKNQTWVSTGLSVTGNEGKARQIMLDMLGEKSEQAAPPDMLFSDAVRRWLEDVRHRVDEVTYQGYEVQARAHILPYFDDLQIRLCDVDGEALQTYINVKAKFGRSDGHGGLSAVSLRQHKNVLNQTLKLAQRDGLIQTNPADLVVMPHAAQFTGTFYTESQMRNLLTAVKNERLYPIIYVTALYGLRRSGYWG